MSSLSTATGDNNCRLWTLLHFSLIIVDLLYLTYILKSILGNGRNAFCSNFSNFSKVNMSWFI